MNCASCGADNAAEARFCIRCGAAQPRAVVGAGRARTFIVVASCVVVALAGYGGWRILETSQSDSGEPPRHTGVAEVPAGGVPPPTDQSAAPLPPPAALPAGAGDVADVTPGSTPGSTPGATPGDANATGAASPVQSENAVAGETDTSERSAAARSAQPTTGGHAGAAGAARSAASETAARETARAAPRSHAPRPRSSASAGNAAPGRSAEIPSGTSPATSVPAQRMATATPPSAPAGNDRWSQMSADLSRCTREDFINRVICDQRVRFRYCDGYWGKVAQCPVSPSTEAVR